MIKHLISILILINDYYRNYSKDEFELLPKWKKEYMTKNKSLIEKYKDLFDEWYNKHKHLLLKKEISF